MIWRCRECGRVASIHIGSSDRDEALLIGSEREDYCAVCDSYTKQVLKRQRHESTLVKDHEPVGASNRDEGVMALSRSS